MTAQAIPLTIIRCRQSSEDDVAQLVLEFTNLNTAPSDGLSQTVFAT